MAADLVNVIVANQGPAASAIFALVDVPFRVPALAISIPSPLGLHQRIPEFGKDQALIFLADLRDLTAAWALIWLGEVVRRYAQRRAAFVCDPHGPFVRHLHEGKLA